MSTFTESVVEQADLAWLGTLGYVVLRLHVPRSIASRQAGGRDIEAGAPGAKRSDPNYRDVLPEAAA